MEKSIHSNQKWKTMTVSKGFPWQIWHQLTGLVLESKMYNNILVKQ